MIEADKRITKNLESGIWLSIIIPVYNTEKYLQECVDSILWQDCSGIEVILVNDGSKDRSGEICQTYARRYENIIYIEQANQGLSAARNVGIKNATGTYIEFLDSDDLLTDDALRTIKNNLINHEYPEMFMIEMFDTINVYAQAPIEHSRVVYECVGKSKPSIIQWALWEKPHTWPAQLSIVQREFLLEKNLFFDHGYLHEDVGWMPRVLALANSYALFIDRPLYIRRMEREGSITNVVNGKRALDAVTLVVRNIRSDEWFSSLTPNVRYAIYRRMVYTTFSFFKDYGQYNYEDQQALHALLKENMDIFQYTFSFRHRLFVLIMRILGPEKALKILSSAMNK